MPDAIKIGVGYGYCCLVVHKIEVCVIPGKTSTVVIHYGVVT